MGEGIIIVAAPPLDKGKRKLDEVVEDEPPVSPTVSSIISLWSCEALHDDIFLLEDNRHRYVGGQRQRECREVFMV